MAYCNTLHKTYTGGHDGRTTKPSRGWPTAPPVPGLRPTLRAGGTLRRDLGAGSPANLSTGGAASAAAAVASGGRGLVLAAGAAGAAATRPVSAAGGAATGRHL